MTDEELQIGERLGSNFPLRTREYVAVKRPLLEAFFKEVEPFWQQYMTKAISHAEYCALIQPAWKAYNKELEPHWVKAGGKKDTSR